MSVKNAEETEYIENTEKLFYHFLKQIKYENAYFYIVTEKRRTRGLLSFKKQMHLRTPT